MCARTFPKWPDEKRSGHSATRATVKTFTEVTPHTRLLRRAQWLPLCSTYFFFFPPSFHRLALLRPWCFWPQTNPAAASPHRLPLNARLVTRIVSVVTKLDCCVSLLKSQAVSFFSMGPKSGAGIQKNRSSRGRCRDSPNILLQESAFRNCVPRWLVGHSLVAR